MTSKKIEKKDLHSIFLRSMHMDASFNYERMQSLAFSYTMAGVLEKLYPDIEDRKKATKRHLEMFNCTSATSPFIAGVITSMEEKKANDPSFDESSINTMKVGLMGPLAGIGDSIFWGSLRVIATGIGVSFAKQGSILGPILFLLIFNIPNFLVRYFGTILGYKAGVSLIGNMASKLMETITYSINILGNVVIGGMVASMVIINIPLKISGGTNAQTVQSLLDSIMPALLPLLLTFFISKILKKGVKVLYILLGIVVISILGAVFGFLAV